MKIKSNHLKFLESRLSGTLHRSCRLTYSKLQTQTLLLFDAFYLIKSTFNFFRTVLVLIWSNWDLEGFFPPE